MRNSTKITSSVTLKTKLIWVIAGFSCLSILAFLLFVYLYSGNPLDVSGGSNSYTSAQTGNWTAFSTWNSTPPPTEAINGDEITISDGHYVTRIGDLDVKNGTTINVNEGATLLIDGQVTVNNNLELNVLGTLTISGDLVAKNEADVVINSSGNVDISGNASFGDNANFIINGTLNIGENITFGANPSFIGSGNIELGGLGCNYWDGNGTCVENTTLPVELLSFDLEKGPGNIILKWETSAETNNDYFSIQKSKNGIDFINIGKIAGKGTTKEATQYSYVDEYPYNGLSYYRLTQTDRDGTYEVFRPLSIIFDATAQKSFNVYPNPLSGDNLFITMNEATAGDLKILDFNGKVVFSTKVVPGPLNNVEINLGETLEKGVYMVQYKTNTFEQSVRLIKI